MTKVTSERPQSNTQITDIHTIFTDNILELIGLTKFGLRKCKLP